MLRAPWAPNALALAVSDAVAGNALVDGSAPPFWLVPPVSASSLVGAVAFCVAPFWPNALALAVSDAVAGNALADGSAPPFWLDAAFWPNAFALAMSDAVAGNALVAGSAPPFWLPSAHAVPPASTAINKPARVHFVHIAAS